MAEQVRKPIPTVSKKDAEELAESDAEVQAAAQKAADLADTDELLDEIDALLEENAEEFVAAYRQKGGE
jgi:ubiquitin-like protein Pup